MTIVQSTCIAKDSKASKRAPANGSESRSRYPGWKVKPGERVLLWGEGWLWEKKVSVNIRNKKQRWYLYDRFFPLATWPHAPCLQGGGELSASSEWVISNSVPCPCEHWLPMWPHWALLLLDDGWLGAEIWSELDFLPEKVLAEELCFEPSVHEFPLRLLLLSLEVSPSDVCSTRGGVKWLLSCQASENRKKGKEEHTSIESLIYSDSCSCSCSCSFLQCTAHCARMRLMASSSLLEGSTFQMCFWFFGLTTKPGTCLTDQSNLCNTSSENIMTHFFHHASVSLTHGLQGSVSNKSTMLLKNASLSKWLSNQDHCSVVQRVNRA